MRPPKKPRIGTVTPQLALAGLLHAHRKQRTKPGASAALAILAAGWLASQNGWAQQVVFGWGENAAGQSSPPSDLDNVKALAAGTSHSLALTWDGRVVAWGDNSSGQTVVPTNLTDAVGIAVWGASSLALKADGTVVRWGASSSLPPGLTNVAAISANEAGPLALLHDGSVVSFDSQTISSPLLSNAVAISVGETFRLALRADGTVAAWGDNDWGQTTLPAGLGGVAAIAAGGWHGLALKTNGTVVAWGANNVAQGNIPADLTNAVAIVAGGWHNLALRSDGTLVGWGANWKGQASVPPLTDVAAVAAGHEYSLASLNAGPPTIIEQPASQVGYSGGQAALTVSARGAQPMSYQWLQDNNPVASGTNATLRLENLSIAQAGTYQVVVSNRVNTVVSSNALLSVQDSVPIFTGLTGNQTVNPGDTVRFTVSTTGSMPQAYQWQFGGNDLPGQTNLELVLTGVHPFHSGTYRVVATNRFGIAVSSNSTLQVQQSATTVVVAWGDNSSGQTNVPLELTDAVALAGGQGHSLALRRNGQVVAWGSMPDVPADLSNVVAVAAGATHSLALRADGTVAAWGTDDWGQLDLPPRLSGVKAIAAGGWHNLALKADGTVVGWGANNAGQISMPQGLTNVAAIAAGGWHNLALRSDGRVVAWGLNDNGQTNVPTGLAGVVAVACGVNHSLALRQNGTVVAWGRDADGQSTVPLDLADVTFVAAGASHSLALKRDGSVVVWGAQPPSPSGVHAALAIAAGWGHSLAVVPSGVRVVVDGHSVWGDSFASRGNPAQIELINPFGDTTMLYTLDGSDPVLSGFLYEGPFTLRQDAVVLAIAYSEDFEDFLYSPAVRVALVPGLQTTSEGGGHVLIDPPYGNYLRNSVAVLTAIPDPGWTFLEWREDATGANSPLALQMTRNKTVKAVFGTTVATLTVGPGQVAVSPASAYYPYGSRLRLTAMPQAGNYFARWGNALSGSNSPADFVVANATPTVVAVFALEGPSQDCSVSALLSGRGEAVVTPPGNRFPRYSSLSVLATPEPGQDFLGWSGAATGSQNPLRLTLLSNIVITANFTARPHLSGENSPKVLAQDGFRLTLSGEWGTAYRIDWSTNLAEWLRLATVTNWFGSGQFTDPAGTNQPFRFYRAAPE